MDILHQLGLDGKRAVIVHHDDLGMLRAMDDAHRALPRFPTGSVMLPTAWASSWAGETTLDLGVHITLTSEWRTPRWRPLTQGASLRDAHGYFWPTLAEAWAHIGTAEAEAEMRAQIEAAFALGIDVTHIDTHMGGVLRPDLAEIYHRLALEYRVPAFIPSMEILGKILLPPGAAEQLQILVDTTPLPVMTLVDAYALPPAERPQWFAETLKSLGPGLYHLIHHAALATPESQALPDWQTRQADFDAFVSPAVNAACDEVELITYRQLRDALRAARLL